MSMCTCREYKEPYRPPSRAGAAKRRSIMLQAKAGGKPVAQGDTPGEAASLAPVRRPR
ncbi:MAG: hypothetical protein KKC30_04885 [Proteobacteria bacterium]|nr:hypothetical protein [Pseudomonadota bacterium]MBU4384094.1 hypothetical protein [Pseudomonadota bacterium]MBU4604526.1 hypothetical protein [Pseudomonadota bacterium]MCG2763733.1 hypothetical protein [Desulfarculaceae bacterium]